MGTAGATLPLLDKLKEPFFIIYGDNYSKINLIDMVNFHYKKESDFTIAIHELEDVSQSGVLALMIIIM